MFKELLNESTTKDTVSLGAGKEFVDGVKNSISRAKNLMRRHKGTPIEEKCKKSLPHLEKAYEIVKNLEDVINNTLK